ncbi:hypothetical protein AB0J83_43565 [Actinoplanes sp. NPDC049596]|uniref:hypothetical protein n=1 Tax=unclassified Actinoplanes TaxID=2626549 RepID=UPI00341AB893
MTRPPHTPGAPRQPGRLQPSHPVEQPLAAPPTRTGLLERDPHQVRAHAFRPSRAIRALGGD